MQLNAMGIPLSDFGGLLEIHVVKHGVHIHAVEHSIHVDTGEQRIDINRLEDEVNQALRNPLRQRLKLVSEPPARRACHLLDLTCMARANPATLLALSVHGAVLVDACRQRTRVRGDNRKGR